jgi:hypothetical protein
MKEFPAMDQILSGNRTEYITPVRKWCAGHSPKQVLMYCHSNVRVIPKVMDQNNRIAVNQTATGIEMTKTSETLRNAISPRQSGFFLI